MPQTDSSLFIQFPPETKNIVLKLLNRSSLFAFSQTNRANLLLSAEQLNGAELVKLTCNADIKTAKLIL